MNHKTWIRSLSTALYIALFVHVFFSYALPRTIAKALFPEQSVQATEVSIAAIWDTGYPNHNTANHASGIGDNYEIIIYPGMRYDWGD